MSSMSKSMSSQDLAFLVGFGLRQPFQAIGELHATALQ
jgi:hypothetical protein